MRESHALLNVEQAKFHIKSVLVYIGIVLSSNNVGDKKCYTGSVYKTGCRTLKKDGPPHMVSYHFGLFSNQRTEND